MASHETAVEVAFAGTAGIQAITAKSATATRSRDFLDMDAFLLLHAAAIGQRPADSAVQWVVRKSKLLTPQTLKPSNPQRTPVDPSPLEVQQAISQTACCLAPYRYLQTATEGKTRLQPYYDLLLETSPRLPLRPPLCPTVPCRRALGGDSSGAAWAT
jgi:hypothetical protein